MRDRTIDRRRAASLAALLLSAALLLAVAESVRASVPAKFFGVSAKQPTEADYRQMGNGGIGSYRVIINWRGAQPTRSSDYNWNPADAQFRLAAENGMASFPIVLGTPRFVSRREGHHKPPVRSKRNRKEWEAFMVAVIRRYGPDGHFWKQNPLLGPPGGVRNLAPRDFTIWNEQNAPTFWRPEPRPAEYATLMRLAHRAARRANPSVRLVVGGMYGSPHSSEGISARSFIRKLYRKRGMKAAIDGINVHPYASGIKGVRRQIKQVRSAARKGGDRPAIWIGELGWASGGSGSKMLTKSRKGQKRMLARSMRMLINKRQAWKIRGVYWYLWRDTGPDAICNWCPKAGLVNKRAKPKPAWDAYRKIIRRHAR
jgi:hypothetical protein